jgi:protein TonB
VQVRVLIGPDGRAQKAEIVHSSGFELLDQTALAVSRDSRYRPGTRGGIPEAMWVTIPFDLPR